MDCCYLVGNLAASAEGVISVQMNSSTEVTKIGDTIIQGPTIGSMNISGYADTAIHNGCPGRAGVSINWLRKYDCDNDVVYLLHGGGGRSYVSGDVSNMAEVLESFSGAYPILNASAASGPTALYESYTQTDGYGLSYSGDPFSFSTGDEPTVVSFDLNPGAAYTLYLQNFTLQTTPGALPTANYSFIFVNSEVVVG